MTLPLESAAQKTMPAPAVCIDIWILGQGIEVDSSVLPARNPRRDHWIAAKFVSGWLVVSLGSCRLSRWMVSE